MKCKRCNCVAVQDSELALLAAQQYYIEHGINLVPVSLHHKLPEYIPARQLKASGTSHWENLVTDTFKQVNNAGTGT